MGLYLLRGDKSLDSIKEGTPANIPKPKRYKIGRNCEAVSPAKLNCANFERYKNLPQYYELRTK
jgi:hypothetical protein